MTYADPNEVTVRRLALHILALMSRVDLPDTDILNWCAALVYVAREVAKTIEDRGGPEVERALIRTMLHMRRQRRASHGQPNRPS